jgi:hypothetical protein
MYDSVPKCTTVANLIRVSQWKTSAAIETMFGDCSERSQYGNWSEKYNLWNVLFSIVKSWEPRPNVTIERYRQPSTHCWHNAGTGRGIQFGFQIDEMVSWFEETDGSMQEMEEPIDISHSGQLSPQAAIPRIFNISIDSYFHIPAKDCFNNVRSLVLLNRNVMQSIISIVAARQRPFKSLCFIENEIDERTCSRKMPSPRLAEGQNRTRMYRWPTRAFDPEHFKLGKDRNEYQWSGAHNTESVMRQFCDAEVQAQVQMWLAIQ